MDWIITIALMLGGIAWLKYILTPPSPIRRPDKRARVITE